jgi:hypothetical protein
MKVNPSRPLYYVKSGRPVSVIETIPVVKYRVQYANGACAELTEAEMDAQLTNEQPRYRFQSSYANGFLIVEGAERSVKFKVRRKFGDFPGQDLSAGEVLSLFENLQRWLADQAGDSRF